MHQCTGLVLVRVVLLLKLYSSQGKVSKLYFSQLLCLFRNTVVSQLHCKMYLVFYFNLVLGAWHLCWTPQFNLIETAFIFYKFEIKRVFIDSPVSNLPFYCMSVM